MIVCVWVFWSLGGCRNPPELPAMFAQPASTEHRVMLGSCEKVKLVWTGRAASRAQPAFFRDFRTYTKKGKRPIAAGYQDRQGARLHQQTFFQLKLALSSYKKTN